MTSLTPQTFEKHYRALYSQLGKKSEPLTSDDLSLVYHGFGDKQGLARYSKETFIQLCQTALDECTYMPRPSWFYQRASELTEASRCLPSGGDLAIRSGGGLALSGQAMLPMEPIAQAEISRILKSEQTARRNKEVSQSERAEALVKLNGKAQVFNPKFAQWVGENAAELALRQGIRRSGVGAAEKRLLHTLTSNRSVRLAYIKFLDGEDGELDKYMAELRRRQQQMVRS
jgi:hypothetical protein